MDFTDKKAIPSKKDNKRTSRKSIFAINQGNIDCNKMNLRNRNQNRTSKANFKFSGSIKYEKPSYLNAVGTPERREIAEQKKAHQSKYSTDAWKQEVQDGALGYGARGFPVLNPVGHNLDAIPFQPILPFNQRNLNRTKEEYTDDTFDRLVDENCDPKQEACTSSTSGNVKTEAFDNYYEDEEQKGVVYVHQEWNPAEGSAGTYDEVFGTSTTETEQQRIEALQLEDNSRNIDLEISEYKNKLANLIIPGAQLYLLRKIPQIEEMFKDENFTRDDCMGTWDTMTNGMDRLILKDKEQRGKEGGAVDEEVDGEEKQQEQKLQELQENCEIEAIQEDANATVEPTYTCLPHEQTELELESNSQENEETINRNIDNAVDFATPVRRSARVAKRSIGTIEE